MALSAATGLAIPVATWSPAIS